MSTLLLSTGYGFRQHDGFDKVAHRNSIINVSVLHGDRASKTVVLRSQQSRLLRVLDHCGLGVKKELSFLGPTLPTREEEGFRLSLLETPSPVNQPEAIFHIVQGFGD